MRKAFCKYEMNDFAKAEEEQILQQLKSREPIFHHPEKFGRTKKDIEDQICDDFFEVGASGNLYTREDIFETLIQRYNDESYEDIWDASGFRLTKISKDSYLITYILTQKNDRVTRRSTIWRNVAGKWKVLYHQGTII